ncbi:hypothetical protein BLS_002776 [Venturia inaequalis]|uniref:Uncharacterized protein n=1 Tax=Venturia inaequalis TaxID=5025 RepID=A0A8H3U0W9_VENIN|nr:hypothetical protein BLS_002776 [Venturia inaequalis]
MAPTSPPIPESKILKSRDPADNDENNRALTGEQYTSSPQHVHGLNITMENGLSIPKSKTLRSRDPDDNDENNRALIGVISANRTRLVVAGTWSEEPEERDGARGAKTGWAGKRGPERGE